MNKTILTMRSKKTKQEIFMDSYRLFITKEIPPQMMHDYLNDQDGDATSNLQSFIVLNMRKEISDWCTGIGIIEATELLYNEALYNGNLSQNQL